MIPIPKDRVQNTAQVLLAVLSDERCVTPNNLLEGVMSGKDLLRALVKGQLVICHPGPAPEEEAPDKAVQEAGA